MATSQDFVNWIPGDELSPRFLLHALRASHRYLVSNASGAIHKTLYMPAAKDFHILLPDLPMQDRIVRQLDAQLAAQADIRRAAETELEAIRSLPAAVIREVFTAK